MSRSQSDVWMGLSASAMARLTTDPHGQAHLHTQSWDGSADTLRSALGVELNSSKLSLLLGPSVARHWLQAPVTGISSLRELHSVVCVRAWQLFGDNGTASEQSDGGWHVSGDWQAACHFICTAWVASLSALGIPLHTPFSLALTHYRRVLPQNGWLAVTVAGELHTLQIRRGHVCSLRSTLLPLAMSATEMQDRALQEWQRARLCTTFSDAQDVSRLHWLNLMPIPIEVIDNTPIVPVTLSRKPLLITTETEHQLTMQEHEAYTTACAGPYLMGVIA